MVGVLAHSKMEKVDGMLSWYFHPWSCVKTEYDLTLALDIGGTLNMLANAEGVLESGHLCVDLVQWVYSEKDTIADNIYEVSKRTGVEQDKLWELVNIVRHGVAERRGLFYG